VAEEVDQVTKRYLFIHGQLRTVGKRHHDGNRLCSSLSRIKSGGEQPGNETQQGPKLV